LQRHRLLVDAFWDYWKGDFTEILLVKHITISGMKTRGEIKTDWKIGKRNDDGPLVVRANQQLRHRSLAALGVSPAGSRQAYARKPGSTCDCGTPSSWSLY
jgi:hypothetical protein